MTVDTNAFLYGNATQAQPSSVSNGNAVGAHFTPYGEVGVAPYGTWRQQLAREGSYFEFFDATRDIATTIAGHTAPVPADIDATFVKATFFIRNISGSTDTKRIQLDWLEIYVKTAGGSGTDALWASEYGSTTRYTSGGTALTVVNPNMQSAATMSSVMTILGGPIVISAENASTRKGPFEVLRPTIEVAGDRKLWMFGHDPVDVTASAAAAVRTQVINHAPVTLGPGDEFMIGIAATSQASPGVYGFRGGLTYR